MRAGRLRRKITKKKKAVIYAALFFIIFLIVFIIGMFFYAIPREEVASIITIDQDGRVRREYIDGTSSDDGFFVRMFRDVFPFSKAYDDHKKTTIEDHQDMEIGEQKAREQSQDENISLEDNVVHANVRQIQTMEDLKKYLYNIDQTAYVLEEDLNINRLLDWDVRADLSGAEPKILIFHTHSTEAFIDSRPGVMEDTIIGMGERLAAILAYEHQITVIHDRGIYDVVDGEPQRGNSYDVMAEGVSKILAAYPSIEVVIDLHRDGLPENIHLVTDINGASTAKVMYFNGITRLKQDGEAVPLDYLPNPYVDENLSFSLQMQLRTNELYPGLTRKIYIRPYRYSLYFRPRSLLVEAGANTNTVQEVSNLMPVLAEVLVDVLQGS